MTEHEQANHCSIALEHVHREYNKWADALTNNDEKDFDPKKRVTVDLGSNKWDCLRKWAELCGLEKTQEKRKRVHKDRDRTPPKTAKKVKSRNRPKVILRPRIRSPASKKHSKRSRSHSKLHRR